MTSHPSLADSARILQAYLLTGGPELDEAIDKAYAANPWFIPEFSRLAVESVAREFLDREKLEGWINTYPETKHPGLDVGVIMAGNVPLVGFHDLLCVLAAGHHARIKLSDKDAHLLPHLTEVWQRIDPSIGERITYVSQLDRYNAVIATGSNNSARYFEYYFRHCPHILRQNRNGVAVLTGQESIEELKLLARDIFLYFGMGCRNVSRLYVPKGYAFDHWEEAVADWQYLGDHHKYKNNLDYNFALYIINGITHWSLGHLILKEDEAMASRIGTVYYTTYASVQDLEQSLEQHRSEIQCVISSKPLDGWDHIPFGEGQHPSLSQYADGVDTMAFLTSL